MNEAALYAARRNKERLAIDDFEFAKDKVIMGTERRSMIISEKEKRTTAVHEGGHALVAKILPGTDPVHKVTIIPRGRALGLTQQLPQEDRLNINQEFALNQVAILMGGRLAEEITFGQKTTGAGNDIEVATNLARSMVCEWGMSEKMGPLAFGKKEGEVFLGREMTTAQHYSEQTARDIDAEVHRIVVEQYERAKQVLLENQDMLEQDRRRAHRVRDARRRRHRRHHVRRGDVAAAAAEAADATAAPPEKGKRRAPRRGRLGARRREGVAGAPGRGLARTAGALRLRRKGRLARHPCACASGPGSSTGLAPSSWGS